LKNKVEAIFGRSHMAPQEGLNPTSFGNLNFFLFPSFVQDILDTSPRHPPSHKRFHLTHFKQRTPRLKWKLKENEAFSP